MKRYPAKLRVRWATPWLLATGLITCLGAEFGTTLQAQTAKELRSQIASDPDRFMDADRGPERGTEKGTEAPATGKTKGPAPKIQIPDFSQQIPAIPEFTYTPGDRDPFISPASPFLLVAQLPVVITEEKKNPTKRTITVEEVNNEIVEDYAKAINIQAISYIPNRTYAIVNQQTVRPGQTFQAGLNPTSLEMLMSAATEQRVPLNITGNNLSFEVIAIDSGSIEVLLPGNSQVLRVYLPDPFYRPNTVQITKKSASTRAPKLPANDREVLGVPERKNAQEAGEAFDGIKRQVGVIQ
jgi:hypothetical protein